MLDVILREVVIVTGEAKCLFHRSTEPADIECGLGYCDLDFDRTMCDGDVNFCERPDALRRYLIEQKRKWERRKGVHLQRSLR